MELSPVRFKTKQAYVYQTLRSEIMHCELAPGEKLVIKDIADRLSVSSIPVREALQLLQSDKLVIHVPHVGAVVSPISKDDIVETFTIKESLEAVSARVAAGTVEKSQLTELREHLGIMDVVLENKHLDQWGSLNRQFHLGITTIAKMPMLREMHVQVLDKWDRIQHYYFHEVLIHRHSQSQKEHYAILDAIARNDAAQAESVTREHNLNALKDYMNLVDSSSSVGERQ